MIKTTFLCDGCSKELTEDEIFHQLYLHESPTKEIHISSDFMVLCGSCALTTDYNLVKLRESLLDLESKSKKVRRRYTKRTSATNSIS